MFVKLIKAAGVDESENNFGFFSGFYSSFFFVSFCPGFLPPVFHRPETDVDSNASLAYNF